MKVLFLCTGNSCRSQMAEGFARALWPASIDVSSAGTEKHGMNERAMQVMAEADCAITDHWSKSLAELDSLAFDVVITVCGHAHETCPIFPGDARVVHRGFDDPPKLSQGLEGEEALDCYRQVRDQIRAAVATMPEELGLV